MYTYNWNTGNYENSKGNVVSWDEVQSNNYQEPPDKQSVKTNMPQSLDDILKGIVNYFGWGLDPKDPKNQDKIEQGRKNVEQATLAIETTNGILTIVVPGGSVAEVMAKLQNGQGMAALAAVPFAILDFVPSEKAASTIIKSVVKCDSKILKLAAETFKGNDILRKEANGLIEQISKGNMSPGIGTKIISGTEGVFEARSRGGARVYFRNGVNGGVEVVGYSNKGNQQTVINRLLELYGK